MPHLVKKCEWAGWASLTLRRVGDDTDAGGGKETFYLSATIKVMVGGTLVVWRLDRLGRSLKDLIELVTKLDDDGIAFQSIREAIDTTSPGGKLVFHIFGALAEFERNLIRERTQAGLVLCQTLILGLRLLLEFTL